MMAWIPIYRRYVLFFHQFISTLFFSFDGAQILNPIFFCSVQQQPLDQSHSNENGGFGFGSGLPGGQLLSTALGMTRAVTQFLGAALQVRFQLLIAYFIRQTH